MPELHRTGTLFEHLAIPNEALAGEGSELEILGQFESVDRASVFAEAAEHAARQIVREMGEDFVLGVGIALTTDDDQVFGASFGAKVAHDAKSFVGLGVDVEAGCAAITLGDMRPIGWILFSCDLAWALLTEGEPQAAEDIEE